LGAIADMPSRRILLINHEYPPLGGGGGNATRQIAKGLARLGHKPYILTTAWAGLPSLEEFEGVVIRRIQAPRADLRHVTTGEAARFMIAALMAAPGLAREWRIDAVLTFFTLPSAPVGWFLKRRCGVPYVIALQSGDVPRREPQHKGFIDRLTDGLIRHLWRDAGAVVANSQALAEQVRAFDDGRKVNVIPAGADVEGITPKEDYAAKDDVHLLYVGRLERHKGLDVLLPALAKLSSALKWRLSLVGDGPEWPVVAALAARYALIDRISLHGWQGWNTLPEIYRSADVFVLPSREEGMPAALLEAMATGLPAVCTQGAGEAVLHGETGLLAAIDDSDALADALTQMIADPIRWETMGRAGRARIESYYSWTNVADTWLDVVEESIAARTAFVSAPAAPD
jgi:glycogen(starch) synthase